MYYSPQVLKVTIPFIGRCCLFPWDRMKHQKHQALNPGPLELGIWVWVLHTNGNPVSKSGPLFRVGVEHQPDMFISNAVELPSCFARAPLVWSSHSWCHLQWQFGCCQVALGIRGLNGEENSGGCLRKGLDESGRKFRKVSGWLWLIYIDLGFGSSSKVYCF